MCLGIPGKIIKTYVSDGLHMGVVDFEGVTREVCLEFTPDVKVGEYTVIHVGFAISRLSEEQAMSTLATLREIISLDEELGIVPQSGAVR